MTSTSTPPNIDAFKSLAAIASRPLTDVSAEEVQALPRAGLILLCVANGLDDSGTFEQLLRRVHDHRESLLQLNLKGRAESQGAEIERRASGATAATGILSASLDNDEDFYAQDMLADVRMGCNWCLSCDGNCNCNYGGTPARQICTNIDAALNLQGEATQITLPLRHWLKCALHLVCEREGIASSSAALSFQPFVMAALKIAISLAEFLTKARNSPTSFETSPTSAASDWAECVMVKLSPRKHIYQACIMDTNEGEAEEACCQDKWEPLLLGSCVDTHNEEEKIMEMNAFLEQSDVAGCTESEVFEQDGTQDNWLHLHPATECEEKEITNDEEFESYLQLVASPAMTDGYNHPEDNEEQFSFYPVSTAASKSIFPDSSQVTHDVDYLSIDSVEIQGIFDGFNSDQHERQLIYYAGLLFYELFGGEIPPPELIALASERGAFVSLSTLTMEKESDEDQSSLFRCAKRHHGPSRSGKEVGLCGSTFEHLKFLGVMTPLCQLIFNMLECVHGDLSGNECYTNIADVLDDLKLMAEKPSKYLKGVTLQSMSLTSSILNELVIPREEQLESLLSCYRRCVAGSHEMAIIKGESGSGKSWLAEQVGAFAASEGGMFLSGKFDQMKQVKPYAAIASAFDQYCDALIRDKTTEWAKCVVEHIKATIGNDDVRHLIEVIPKLHRVLDLQDNTTESVSSINLNCENAVHRLHFLMCQFVEAISSSNMDGHMTLFLDDIQWCDEASLSVLQRLLRKKHKKLFFLCACRDNEMQSDHSFWKMMLNLCATGIKSSTVKMKCLEVDEVNSVVSDLLCLPPHIVRSLSFIVHRRTKGNVLFVSQLLLSLNRDGYIHLDLDRQRWVWDEEKINSIQYSDNVARCFTDGIRKLPLEVQSAVHTLATFGASAKSEHIQSLEKMLNVKLQDPLNDAVEEGLVTRQNDSYKFCHDRIQEASYNLVEDEYRRSNHLNYGRCLIEHWKSTGEDTALLTAVNQINFGGAGAVSEIEEFVTFAEYNEKAGKKSMACSDFASAYFFFDNGISFLRKDHWKNNYQLSLQLYELASQCALAIGNSNALHVLSHQVLSNAKCFEDKLHIYYIKSLSMAYASKTAQALDTCLSVVLRLGQELPSDPTQEVLESHMQQTHALIENISTNTLLNYKKMTDTKMLLTMKFFSQIQLTTTMIKPSLFPLVAMKMVQMTFSEGLSPSAPYGFACYATFLAKLGNIQEARWSVSLALALLNNSYVKDGTGEVLCLAAEVQSYLEPMQSANELKVRGEADAMSAGDIHWACVNRLGHCVNLFWAGTNLTIVNEKISNACKFMNEYEHNTSLILMLMMQRTALMLSRKDCNILSMEDLSKKVQENKNPRQAMMLSTYDLYLSFMLSHDVKECCKRFFQCKKSFESESSALFLFVSDFVQVFFVGLASFQIYRDTGDSLWVLLGSKQKEQMKLWSEKGCQINFQQKLLLLQAEEDFCHGHNESARVAYNSAIKSAQLHKFVNDEALAHELAAKFYFATDDMQLSLVHFRLAVEKYHEWGAVRKAEELHLYAKERFDEFQGSGFMLAT